MAVGHTEPKCGPPSMGQVQWLTATNPLHTYQMHEGPVSTFTKVIKHEKYFITYNESQLKRYSISGIFIKMKR